MCHYISGVPQHEWRGHFHASWANGAQDVSTVYTLGYPSSEAPLKKILYFVRQYCENHICYCVFRESHPYVISVTRLSDMWVDRVL